MWRAPLFAYAYSAQLNAGDVAGARAMWDRWSHRAQADVVLALAGQARYAARQAHRAPDAADLAPLCRCLRAWVESAYLRGREGAGGAPACRACLRDAAIILVALRARIVAAA